MTAVTGGEGKKEKVKKINKIPDNIPAMAKPPPLAETKKADQEQPRSDTKLKNKKKKEMLYLDIIFVYKRILI